MRICTIYWDDNIGEAKIKWAPVWKDLPRITRLDALVDIQAVMDKEYTSVFDLAPVLQPDREQGVDENKDGN